MQRAGGVVHWARDGAEANAIVASDRAGARRARGDQGQVDRHRRDRAQRRPGRAGDQRDRDRPGGADPPALERQDLAHPGPGDPPQPDGDQGAVRAHDHRREARHGGVGDRRGGAAAPAREVPLRADGGVGRELRRRRDGHGRGGRVRGQRAHVHDAAEGARDRDGDREGPARVARPRGLPPAAAALVDGRADEPVHVAVDRRAGRRRAGGVPPRAARRRADQRAGRRARPPGAALHPLLGVPERVPGLLARRRAGLRVGLSRARSAPCCRRSCSGSTSTRRCRGRRRCAAPATTPARSRSRSRRCSCTCAGA